ncbi:MAG: bifunctional homocysteine S-methyltransferase/methylenetetrahydrofolate reductase [Rubrobacteraceae bacterium]|nr:bifunctional homocysteine S-methyltransferase/methylenetetrahydrofolate reductase [Rubrobacteraceae bacterium]MDQ3435971.1 bifunctional homocysteine S-methyltransferase/methylenetetrahydrofolate reductase [Actinomycetota bacterium]
MSPNLRELLATRVLIGDGAVGTLLGERGVGFGHPYARANLSHPEMVTDIHVEYLRAGADVIETNTFAANRFKLETHDLEERVREVNAEGASLARKAAYTVAGTGDRALVLGAIGPLGRPLAPVGPVSPERAKSVFLEQAEALLEGGADAILLETFTDLVELRLAYEAVGALGAPVLAYKTFVEDGETLAEGLPGRAAREISSWGADLAGANCTVGPQRMVEIIGQMADAAGPVAALPNPGLPQIVGGHIRFSKGVDHFAEYGIKLAEAGARLVGGCCGTTPAHVKALSEALQDFRVEGKRTRRRGSVAERTWLTEVSVEPVSEFAERLRAGFAVTVEVDLPRGNAIEQVVEAARRLKERGVHAIDISDGARARLRMHPVAAARIVQDEAGIEVVAHISCRDRNIIGLQADLLGAAALGVKNILAVTGDPAQIGDYPEATSVFDTDSVGLVHILSRMNRGEDLAGNPIGEPPGFLVGASFNPTAEDLDEEVEKLRRKVEAGAHAFWTQPVFEIGGLENALERIGVDGVCILLGLMPLRSARQAEFLHHEVPGIDIPKHVREKLAALSPEDAPKYGVEVAQELLIAARPLIGGAYIMPPASAPDLAGDVLEAISLPAGR